MNIVIFHTCIKYVKDNVLYVSFLSYIAAEAKTEFRDCSHSYLLITYRNAHGQKGKIKEIIKLAHYEISDHKKEFRLDKKTISVQCEKYRKYFDFK